MHGHGVWRCPEYAVHAENFTARPVRRLLCLRVNLEEFNATFSPKMVLHFEYHKSTKVIQAEVALFKRHSYPRSVWRRACTHKIGLVAAI
jgi:hypothetical protein